ncbi:hypothetical protein [Chitinophaga sp. OAE865]|uniref:hypothetical protein n=1 Tax=Chitinophaga sp. OAE865 TaxID=2817898 RepID=UPI001AE45170
MEHLQKRNNIAIRIEELQKDVEQSNLLSREAITAIKKVFNVDAVNDKYAYEPAVKDDIATALTAFALIAWNKDRDLGSATTLVKWALGLYISDELRQNIWVYEKQLEELYGKHVGQDICYFCAGAPHDNNSALEKKLYIEKDRSNYIVARKVKFSVLELKVPRCGRCANEHDTLANKYHFTWVGIVILFVVIGAFTGGLIIFGLLGVGIGYLVARYVKNYLKQEDIKENNDDIIGLHPQVAPLLEAGWSFEQPQA